LPDKSQLLIPWSLKKGQGTAPMITSWRSLRFPSSSRYSMICFLSTSDC